MTVADTFQTPLQTISCVQWLLKNNFRIELSRYLVELISN